MVFCKVQLVVGHLRKNWWLLIVYPGKPVLWTNFPDIIKNCWNQHKRHKKTTFSFCNYFLSLWVSYNCNMFILQTNRTLKCYIFYFQYWFIYIFSIIYFLLLFHWYLLNLIQFFINFFIFFPAFAFHCCLSIVMNSQVFVY